MLPAQLEATLGLWKPIFCFQQESSAWKCQGSQVDKMALWTSASTLTHLGHWKTISKVASQQHWHQLPISLASSTS